MPGRLVFQLMSFSVHWAGIVVASLSPLPLGPRKRVHSWAEAAWMKGIHRKAKDSDETRRMTVFLMGGGGVAGR